MAQGRRLWKKLALLCILLILYTAAVRGWDDAEGSLWIVLTGTFPGYEQAAAVLKAEEGQEEPFAVCFYEGMGWQEIQEKETGRTLTAEAGMLLGKGRLYHPRLKEALLEDDRAVIISSDIAWTLWGSREVQGKEILWRDKTYVVSQVLSDKGSFFLVKGREGFGSFHTILMESRGTQSESVQIRNFLIRNALTGERADIRLLQILTKGLLYAIPAGMLVMFLQMLGAEARDKENTRIVRISCLGFAVLTAVGAAWLVFKDFSWPKEWIPNRWADFSFWGEKYRELCTSMRYYFRTAKTAVQVRELIQIARTMALSLTALLLEIFMYGQRLTEEPGH